MGKASVIKIDLTVNIRDLYDVMYQKKEYRFFFGPQTEYESLFLITGIFIFSVTLLNFVESKNYLAIYFGVCMFFLSTYLFLRVVRRIIKQKNEVCTFLPQAKAIKKLQIQYTDEFIRHIQDDRILEYKWEEIHQAFIQKKFILLKGSQQIWLPKTSMKEAEYTLLSETILQNVKIHHIESD